MLEIELIQLVNKIITYKYKCNKIELRDASSSMPSQIYKTLSSFSNQIGGGIIICGLDVEKYEVVGVYDLNDLKKNIIEQSLQMQPIVTPFFTVATINNKYILSVEISECSIYDKPCYYKGAGILNGSYTRVYESNQQMTEYEIYNYESYNKKIRDELRVVYRASMEDLARSKLDNYLVKIRKAKNNISNFADNRILETQGIIRNDVPTMAGLLLFGEYPQEFFPHLYINITVYNERKKKDKSGDYHVFNKCITGSLPQMLSGSLEFIKKYIKLSFHTPDSELNMYAEYPLITLKELVLNSLIHRDYSTLTESFPINLAIYKDRFEIENPGCLFGKISLEDIGTKNREIRNPYIYGAMSTIINFNKSNSGILKIKNELNSFSMPEPVFINRKGFFKVIVYKNEYNGILEVSLEQEIINYCIIPRTKEELAEKFGFQASNYFRKKYLNSLLESGKLKMEIPDKPQSKYQKYYSK